MPVEPSEHAHTAPARGANLPTMIDFYFDISSPWTYLAFHNIQPMAAELGVAVRWKPILVGGVFNSINPSVYEARERGIPAKRDYLVKDVLDWARHAGIRIVFPPRVFPVNSVKVMRACIWLDAQGRLPAFARAAFEIYWGQDQDISQDAVIGELCRRTGDDADALFAAIARPEVKQRLRANTDELVARGGFGSPTMYVGDDMYFGNDRLVLVREAVRRVQAAR